MTIVIPKDKNTAALPQLSSPAVTGQVEVVVTIARMPSAILPSSRSQPPPWVIAMLDVTVRFPPELSCNVESNEDIQGGEKEQRAAQ